MENKRLMQHLLRDVSDLERIIVEVKNSGAYDLIDIELIHTRISGVKRMLEIAAGEKQQESINKPFMPQREPEKPKPEEKPESCKIEKESEEKIPLYEEPEEKRFRGMPITEEAEEEKAAPQPARTFEEKKVEPQPEKPEFRPSINIGFMQDTPPAKKEPAPPVSAENEIKLKDEKKESSPQTLGEKFTQNRSVNDLMAGNDKNADYKFSKVPVSSLLSGIGINDRFLFTRELFDGDIDSYYDTVSKIDAMTDINEAANFLRDNFKWNKTETSLKFIDLIKRRFL